MYRFVLLLLALAGCLGAQAEKEPADTPVGSFRILVVSSSLNELEIYDYPGKNKLASVKVDSNPRDVLLSPDKNLAFINNLDAGTITVVDLTKFAVVKSIEVGDKPWDMRILPGRGQLYVSNYGDASVAVIDLESLSVVAKIRVGEAPMSMSFADEGRLVFVGNSGSNDVSVIDTISLGVKVTIPVGPRPEHVVTNSDYVFVNNQGDNTITVIHIALLDKPVDTFKADEIAECGPMVSEQDYTYTTLPEENLVLKLWTDDMSLEGKIPVGERPYQFVFSPDYSLGFVTNSGSNDVSVIDLQASTVIETMPVGERPMGIAVF
jgi:YVTN family beta-propeller protein